MPLLQLVVAGGKRSQDGQAFRLRRRVVAARALQVERQGKPNADLGTGEIDRHCRPDDAARGLLQQAIVRLNLSDRSYHRVLRVARSIADLAAASGIGRAHVAEAVHYRRGLGGD